jgi:hypothetical protein
VALDVPPALAASPLLRGGGFAVYEELPDAATKARLRDEARSALASAAQQECWVPDTDEVRGGTPRRRLLTAGAGPAQDALYASPWLHATLSDTCGVPIVPSGNRGSYSYYVRAGDFLGLHRDIDTCDLAMITVLHDSGPGDQSGALVMYPGRIAEPLSSIRGSPADGACVVGVGPGQTIVMLGGLVPHRVRRVSPGQARVVSVLCFRALVA